MQDYQQPDFEKVARLDQKWKRTRNQDYKANLRIFEALWAEAVALGAFEDTDPLAHIDIDIRLARTLNV